MPRSAYSPSSVSPLVLHCASPAYEGTVTPAGNCCWIEAGVGASPIGLSCCGPAHFSVCQKVPVDRNCPALIAVPSAPSSKRTPHSALSNLWHRNMLRTPSPYSSSRPRSMSARLHWATSRTCLQPKGSEVSTPSTTASLPWRTTSRACALSVTIRNQPLPGPPYILSTYAWRSHDFWASSRIAVISSQLRSLKK